MKFRRFLQAGAAAVVATTLVIALCPKPSLYGDTGFSTAIEDRNGELLRLLLADDDRYRLKVSLDDISPAAIDATLLYEDRYFHSHPGFNPAALLRAAWVTWGSRERVMGASTITMQLARVRFDLDTRSVGGKLLQIARAVQLERHYSKQEILEAYLNLAPYGGNVEGIGTASIVYFGKPASRLSLPEALTLAVIPQNPAKRNPSTAGGYEQAMTARSRLLVQWREAYGLDEIVEQQFTMPLAVSSVKDLPFEAPHFVQNVVGRNPARQVHRTSLDIALQNMLEARIDEHVDRFANVGIHNASAMLVDTRTMQVLASAGSAEFMNDDIQGQVDGTDAKRSPGSTLKPFVYAMALDQGLIHPKTMLRDAPRRFAAYTPENFDRGFLGPVFAEDALVYSRNVPAIELLAAVGHDSFNAFLTDGDVTGLREADHYGLAAVLGGLELTMQEVIGLYAMLANDGVLRPLQFFAAGNDQNGGRRLLSPEASFLVLDMLRKNPRPNALNVGLNPSDISIAWKTGTSYAFRDAWSVGVLGPYALAVWVGNFDGSGNPALVGREAAAPLFFSIADSIVAATNEDFAQPEPSPDRNLTLVDVCARTGDLPGRYCPNTMKSWFIPGVSPIDVSNVHRAVQIDASTGLRSCNPGASDSYEAVYEFWPSDISQLFRRAGIAIRRPPPWSPECTMDVLATTGLAPNINSLSENLVYQLRGHRVGQDALPLTASTDADVESLYWFVGDHFVGKVASDEALLWEPVAGVHQVLAVDDLGRSDSLRIAVAQAP